MRVSFDGNTYDPDADDEALRAACKERAARLTSHLVSAADLENALIDTLAGVQLIAVKLGAVAAMHHAYAAPVSHELVDVFAHTLNKLVGLNYVPPEQIQIENEQQQEVGGEQQLLQ
jgi:hypothetical protein